MNPGLSPRLTSLLIGLAVVVLFCGGIFVYSSKQGDAQCRSQAAAVAAPVHTDTEPLANELDVFGQIREVHWIQTLQGGACNGTSDAAWYERSGLALIEPTAAVELATLYPWDSEGIEGGAAPEQRLSAWLPSNPQWHHSTILDQTLTTFGRFSDDYASYLIDLDRGSVYFVSRASIDAAELPG